VWRFWQSIRDDAISCNVKGVLFGYVFSPSFRVLVLIRIVTQCYGALWGWGTIVSKWYSLKLIKEFSMYVHPKVRIAKGVHFPHPTGIVLGEGVEIGEGAVIYQNVTLGLRSLNDIVPTYPRIGEKAVIYANAVIVGDVYILPGQVVGAGKVVVGPKRL
jgi:serine O-acetyltransferase